MGERWLCKPEVVGSIPISSTERRNGLAVLVKRGRCLAVKTARIIDN